MAKVKAKTIYVIDFNTIEKHVKWLIDNRVNKHDFRQYPSKVILLDFSRSRFLKPYHIAPLACLIHEYQNKGFIVRLSKIPKLIKDYLDSFDFDQFCHTGQSTNTFVPTDTKTFPLWHIVEPRKEFYIIEVQKYFENNHFSGQDLFVLGNSLAELMNNIFDHALSKIPGYTFTQLNTRSSQIITCVCDFGIGIPTSVNKFLKSTGNPILTNDLALTKALERNFSTLTRPHNRGFGWNNIFERLQSQNNKLLIVSNNALYLMQHDGTIKSQLLNSNFPGTLVVIYLNTKNLPVKEEEQSDELLLL
jgi:hypothetical protein